MKWLRSIRVRFTGWYLIVLAILLVLLSVGLYLHLSYALRRNLDLGLVHQSEQLAAMPDIERIVEEGKSSAVLGELVAFYTRTDDGYKVVAPSPIESLIDKQWIDGAVAGRSIFVTVSNDDRLFRFYVALLRPPGISQIGPRSNDGLPSPPAAGQDRQLLSPTVLVIGRPMEIVTSPLVALRGTLVYAVPLTLLLSAGGGLFLVRRALVPVDRMIETARGIEEGDLDKRVAVSSHDELGRLAQTLNDMLERLAGAFQRQRRFTDDASHELRSPLSVIEAEVSLALRRERSVEDYRDALATVSEEAGKLKKLIDQLLALARGDANEQTLPLGTVDLAEMARETVAAMTPLAEEAGVRLVTRAPDAVTAIGRLADLRRLLTNLVDNAIRHTQAGGSVEVSVHSQVSDAELAVTDTGIGIPPDDLPHIFDRFYRVDRARSRASGGRGLGLAICKQIVEAHGGKIEVESTPNKGTRFSVRLPRHP